LPPFSTDPQPLPSKPPPAAPIAVTVMLVTPVGTVKV
jgi:hypothetical protein